MTVRWITPLLGTAPALLVDQDAETNIVDVRDLVDKAGNRAEAVRQKITEGCASLRRGERTVVCCDHGISRSNAIAAGILAMHESIPFETAVRRVLEATGETDIKVGPLQSVRKALGEEQKKTHHEKRRILVTDGADFLGQRISQQLGAEFAVIGPGRDELDLHRGSTQLDLIAAERGIDCMVHLASPRVHTSNAALGDTLTALRNVLDVCVVHDIKLIHLSGWEVYSGYRSSHLMADESLPLLPKGPDAEAKYLCEILIEHSRRTQGLRCAQLRPGPVYGIGSDKPAFIYHFIDRIKQSRQIVTHAYNNGLPALDLLYIDDLVAAVVQTAGSEFCGDLNIGTGVITSTQRVAEILRNLLGGRNEITSTPIDSDIACIAMDAGKARKVLGWQATIGVEQGLQRILSNLKAD